MVQPRKFRAAFASVIGDLADEAAVAQERYGPFASTHEAFGVLAEEIQELLDAIRANAMESVRTEALQVAAVAARLAAHCRDDAAFRHRSGA